MRNKELTCLTKPDSRVWIIFCVTVLSLACHIARGHGVNVFAYVDGQKIFVEGYFTGKSKAVDALVEVFDSHGNKIHEGRTDNNGVYSFKIFDVVPARDDLRIVLKASPEHQAEFRLPASDLPKFPKRKKGEAENLKTTSDQENELNAVKETAQMDSNQAIVKKLMEEAVDSKIQPLAAMLSQQQKLLIELNQKKISVTEILGGIGWIFGIVGVAAYMMGRRHIKK